MTRNHQHLTHLVLASILCLGSAAIDLTVASAQAKPDAATLSQNQPAGGRVPGRRRGGARRGDCPAAATELTALVPMTEISTPTLPQTYVGGNTTAAYPTFWFYVPYSLTPKLTAEFVVQDDAGQEVYRVVSTDFPITEQTPGMVSISLPSTIAPLQIGQVYRWYFKLNCGMEVPMYVRGGIQRVALAPNLVRQLANASSQAQAQIYSANNLWYDAIAVLAKLHRNNPTNRAIASEWQNLLQTLKLEDIPIN